MRLTEIAHNIWIQQLQGIHNTNGVVETGYIFDIGYVYIK